MSDKDTREMSDDELVRLAGRAQKINEAPIEAMLRLKNSIESLNQSSSRYSKILIWLTATMTVAVIIQIYLLFK